MLPIVHTANAATDNSAAFAAVIKPIITNIIDPLLVLAFAVALVAFVYGILQLVMHGTDSEAHTKGKWSILGGLIGMFLMVSAWGIIVLISNTVLGFR